MATAERPNVASLYERDVLPALVERLDEAFPEFGWQRDPRGWHATNQAFTHATLGVRADRVVCHGSAPRGFLVHGQGPVLWTTYVNHGQAARGREFVDAVRRLAERAGVDPSSLDRPPTAAERKAVLVEDAFAVCRSELASERGAAARAYLTRRGIPRDRLDELDLGVVPAADRLRLALTSRGHGDDELDASGILADSRWPGRIVGAWRGDRYAIVTLWARAVDDEAEERYLYLRGAPRAAAMPYGFSDIASSRVAAGDALTLVEGVIDVHVLRAHGFSSVAALGGTSAGCALFERLADRGIGVAVLAFDNDAAGRAALVRTIEASVRADRSPDLWLVDPDLYDGAKDPADVVQAGGATAWRAVTSASTCAVTWRALDLTGPLCTPDAPLAKRAALARAAAWLGTLPARLAVEQAAALSWVAESLGYDADAVRQAFRARYWRREPAPSASRGRGPTR